jgi:DNA (cytosine-5)-methyltransferase 1
LEESETDIWDPSVPPEQSGYFWNGTPKVFAPRLQPANVPSVIDLFCGAGGLAQGFRQAGFQSILAVDQHKPSVDTFSKNHPEAATILGDIRRVSDGQILDALAGIQPAAVIGGAPCQGFSLCNRKQFDDDPRNSLFVEYMRIVRLVKPTFVLFENVANIRSVGTYTRQIEDHFEELGYKVTGGPVSALDFGVPQSRVRWIYLGISQPKPPGRPIGEYRGRAPLTVRDAIGDLPRLGNDDSTNEYCQPPTTPFQEAMRGAQRVLLNHCSPKHPQETIDRIARTRPGSPMYPTFKQRIRLSWDTPSPTQVSGGIRPQFQFGHPDQPRGLSIRERCRIQSFPDHYEIFGGIVQGRVQTGNAVPPKLAEAFARVIMGILTGEELVEVVEDQNLLLPLAM